MVPETTTLAANTTVFTTIKSNDSTMTPTEPHSASSQTTTTTIESLSSELNHIDVPTTSPISSSASTIISVAPNDANYVQVTMPISLPTSTPSVTQPTTMKTTKSGSVFKSTTTKTRPKTQTQRRTTLVSKMTTTSTSKPISYAPAIVTQTGSYNSSTESLAAYHLITNASMDALKNPFNSSTAILVHPPIIESFNFSSAIAMIAAANNESSTESNNFTSNAQAFIASNQTTATPASHLIDFIKSTTIATLLIPVQNVNQTADSNNYTTFNLPISLSTTLTPLLNQSTTYAGHTSTATTQSTEAQSLNAGITLSPLNANNITSTSIVIEKPITSTERPAMMVTSLPISSPNVGKDILYTHVCSILLCLFSNLITLPYSDGKIVDLYIFSFYNLNYYLNKYGFYYFFFHFFLKL
jgi:hypothetical protein